MTQTSEDAGGSRTHDLSSQILQSRCKDLERENLEYKMELEAQRRGYEERIRDLERRNADLFQERDNLKNYCDFLTQICRETEAEGYPAAPPNTPTEGRKSLGAVSTVEDWVEPIPRYFGETLIHFRDKREGASCPSLRNS